jgi:folylpolyglutamate synthase/dihydropteroate synthase
VQESLLLAKKLTDNNAVIIIAGSLFLAGEARDIILHDKKHSPANA